MGLGLAGRQFLAIFAAALQPSAVTEGIWLLPAVLLAGSRLASEPRTVFSGVEHGHLLNLATRAGISSSRHVGRFRSRRAAVLTFKLDLWDFLALAAIMALVGVAVALGVFILNLPGRITACRKRPDAALSRSSVRFRTLVPWIKRSGLPSRPTDTIEFRYRPNDERRYREKPAHASEVKTDSGVCPSRDVPLL